MDPVDIDDDMVGQDESKPGLLDASYVNLINFIEAGIPPQRYVPGCKGWLREGKRYLIPAAAGSGKSLAFLIVAVGIIQHGGTVVILDVENGREEYGRRLQCILNANDDRVLTEQCREHLFYFEWPALSLKWSASELVETMTGADLVIFDSSRLALSQVGLDEDRSGDYATFVNAFLLPLARAGITTVVLDNVGHANGDRARGSSAKSDLNEAAYTLKQVQPFDENRTGTLQFSLTRTRFGDLERKLEMRIGGGVFEMPRPVENVDEKGEFRPTVLMRRVSAFLAEHPGASARTVKEQVRGDTRTIPLALKQLIKEGFVRTEPGEHGSLRHHLVELFEEE